MNHERLRALIRNITHINPATQSHNVPINNIRRVVNSSKELERLGNGSKIQDASGDVLICGDGLWCVARTSDIQSVTFPAVVLEAKEGTP